MYRMMIIRDIFFGNQLQTEAVFPVIAHSRSSKKKREKIMSFQSAKQQRNDKKTRGVVRPLEERTSLDKRDRNSITRPVFLKVED